MRDLTWSELLDLVTSNPTDPATTDAAWAELHRRVSVFFAIIRRGYAVVTAEDAEDLVQQLLLRMREPRVLDAIRTAQTPHAYVMRMARNSVIDHIRRSSPRVAMNPEPLAMPPPEVTADVAVLLRTLSAEDQILLKMRFWDDMPIGEIARVLDLPYSTIAKRLFRAVEKLRTRHADPAGEVN